MQPPEVLQGSNGDLKELDGAHLDEQKDSAPVDASDLPSGKVSAADSAAAQDSHRRSGRTRTVRVRDGFFDSSLLHYVSLDAAPRDGFPARRSPKPPRPPKAKAGADDSEDEEDWDGTGVGADYQADIPAFRPRPAKPSASEAKFLALKPLYVPVEVAAEVTDDKGKVTKTRAGRAGVMCPMPPIGVAASSADFRYKWRWCKDSAAKRSLLSAAVHALDKQLGDDKVKKLGLESLGFKLRDCWQPQEELLFALGMCDKYRMFKYIRQSYLWRRSTHELNAYYHNVWKTRSTDLADEFLTMREEDATRLEYMAFVDKVRDQIVSIWDKKTMGDMPKVVKDMAAAAAAERAAGPTKVHIKQQQQQRSSGRQQVDVYAHSDSDDYLSDSSGETDDSARRAARKRVQQQARKRQSAAMSGGAVGRPPKRPAGSGGSSGQGMYENGRYRAQGVRRPWELPAPTGSGLEQWLHPGQPKAQKPRTAFQRRPGHAKMDLPEMPQAQLPDPNNKEEVAAWLKRLPDFRRSLKTHLETVDNMTEAAIEDCQRFIKESEDQRQSREDYAEQYIGILMQHGRSILVKLEDAELQEKQAQLAQQQADATQPNQQLDGQQEHRAAAALDAPAGQAAAAAAAGAAATAGGGSASPGASADQQQQQQQQQPEQADVEMSDAPVQAAAQPVTANGRQQQQQQQGPEQAGPSAQQSGAGQDAVRIAMGPPPARPPRPQQDGMAVDGPKQQEDEPQQQSDTAAGVDVGAGAGDLPFPGGPLLGGWGVGQWTSQPLGPAAMPWLKQPMNTPGSVAQKPIPRPYMHRTSS